MTNYMDSRVTPPKQVTSPTWGPPPPCKQALKCSLVHTLVNKYHRGRASSTKFIFVESEEGWGPGDGGGVGNSTNMGIDEPLSVLKPWPCFIELKNPKIRTMFYRTTPLILVPCLGQGTNARRLIQTNFI